MNLESKVGHSWGYGRKLLAALSLAGALAAGFLTSSKAEEMPTFSFTSGYTFDGDRKPRGKDEITATTTSDGISVYSPSLAREDGEAVEEVTHLLSIGAPYSEFVAGARQLSPSQKRILVSALGDLALRSYGGHQTGGLGFYNNLRFSLEGLTKTGLCGDIHLGVGRVMRNIGASKNTVLVRQIRGTRHTDLLTLEDGQWTEYNYGERIRSGKKDIREALSALGDDFSVGHEIFDVNGTRFIMRYVTPEGERFLEAVGLKPFNETLDSYHFDFFRGDLESTTPEIKLGISNKQASIGWELPISKGHFTISGRYSHMFGETGELKRANAGHLRAAVNIAEKGLSFRASISLGAAALERDTMLPYMLEVFWGYTNKGPLQLGGGIGFSFQSDFNTRLGTILSDGPDENDRMVTAAELIAGFGGSYQISKGRTVGVTIIARPRPIRNIEGTYNLIVPVGVQLGYESDLIGVAGLAAHSPKGFDLGLEIMTMLGHCDLGVRYTAELPTQLFDPTHTLEGQVRLPLGEYFKLKVGGKSVINGPSEVTLTVSTK